MFTKLKSLSLIIVQDLLPGQSISNIFFLERNKVLEDISIYNCEQFTDVDLLHIALNCPYLKKIEFVILGISDRGIVNLFSVQHKTFEDIDILNCSNLSDVGLLTI